jgi:hypothetical protein
MEAEYETDNLLGMAAKPEVVIEEHEHEPDVSSSEENQTPDPSKFFILPKYKKKNLKKLNVT